MLNAADFEIDTGPDKMQHCEKLLTSLRLKQCDIIEIYCNHYAPKIIMNSY